MMYRAWKTTHRLLLGAGVVALAVAGVCCTTALAGGAYTVKVKVVPTTVPIPGTFRVSVGGHSANLSQLTLFLNGKRKCAKTAVLDASHPGDHLKLKTGVVGPYAKVKTFHAVNPGTHYACAYLTGTPPQKLPRAHAGARYAVG